MKRRLACLLAAGALVVGACGDSSQALATVNDEDITVNFMASLRESYRATINVNTEEFRVDLGDNIIRVAIAQRAESDFGITVTDTEIDERIANPPPQWQSLFADLAADADTTEEYARTQAQLSIIRDRVGAALIRAEEGFIDGIVNDTPHDVTAGCLRHILVATEAEAEAALERVSAGEDFATVATELTLDTVSGGDFLGGCPASFSGLTPAVGVAAATGPLDEPFGPLESEFGFHVLLVEQRVGPPTAEQLAADPVFYFPGVVLSNFFTPWFNAAVRESEITVSDSVGRWSETGLGIAPPEG